MAYAAPNAAQQGVIVTTVDVSSVGTHIWKVETLRGETLQLKSLPDGTATLSIIEGDTSVAERTITQLHVLNALALKAAQFGSGYTPDVHTEAIRLEFDARLAIAALCFASDNVILSRPQCAKLGEAFGEASALNILFRTRSVQTESA